MYIKERGNLYNKELLKNCNILLVEDNQKFVDVIDISLNKVFNNIFVAYNGQDGIKLYEEKKDIIDVIITDIEMPFLNGFEMIKHLKNSYATLPPILIISAFSDNKNLLKAINLGVEGFLLKPLDLNELIKKIEKLVEIKYYKEELKIKDNLLFQQAKMAAMGEMISNIAHQWRQPLNTIGILTMRLDAYLEIDKVIEKEFLLETTTYINKVLQDMSQTIDDFRDFFKPSTSKEKFNFKNFFDSLLLLVKPNLTQNSIELEIIGDKNIEIYSYESQLKQVILNLINNAKDALIENHIQNPKIIVEFIKCDKNICIYIKDNANGIDKEILDRIFEPYFTTKFKSRGTGLGLYISKLIVEKNLDGNLIVSTSANGTTFEIQINLE